MPILRLEDQRTVPWRNGRGVTVEVCVVPAGADLDAFDARLSIAAIDADGPFSPFPGVDRVLFLLDGAGVDLFGPEGAVRLSRPGDRLRFLGESAVMARLVDGPVRDVNWMTRRDRVAGEATWARLDGELVLKDEYSVALVIDGQLSADGVLLRRLDVVQGPGVVLGTGTVVQASARVGG